MILSVAETLGKQTWDEHQDAVGDDQNLHCRQPLCGGQDASVDPHVHDEPYVEQETEPADGGSLQRKTGLSDPEVREYVECLCDQTDLEDKTGDSKAHGDSDQGRRHTHSGPLDRRPPQLHHAPGLGDERRVDEHYLRDGERRGCDADAGVVVVDELVVVGPVGVEVEEAGRPVQGEEDVADDAHDQGGDVDGGRHAGEAVLGRHGQHDQEHHEAGADLRAVVDLDGGALLRELVQLGHGDVNGVTIWPHERHVLVEETAIRHWVAIPQSAMPPTTRGLRSSLKTKVSFGTCR